MQTFYQVGDRFRYLGTTYTIKSITENGIELSSRAEQSLWEARDRFEQNLNITGKSGLFAWENECIVRGN